MKIAVIGRGPIGSAAARYLGEGGHDVTLIGPDEPGDMAAHRGVFASHYAAGRIARSLDADGFWADVSRASIARYAALEAASGIRFFTECGALLAGVGGSDWIAAVDAVRHSRGIGARPLRGAELRSAFPYFRLAADTEAYYEARGAGYIDPRRLVQAQCAAFRRSGGTVLPATALGLRETGQAVTVRTDAGELRADRVLVAAGGFSNRLLDNALALTVFARTVTLFEVDAAEAARLAGMPSLVLRMADGRAPYLLPPIRYPDGRIFAKLGGDPDDRVVQGDQIGDWFRGGGSAAVTAYQTEIFREILPGLAIVATRTEPCVTTFTRGDRPLIGPVSHRVAVATAGCGRGAKCSDELGRLGADAVAGLD